MPRKHLEKKEGVVEKALSGISSGIDKAENRLTAREGNPIENLIKGTVSERSAEAYRKHVTRRVLREKSESEEKQRRKQNPQKKKDDVQKEIQKYRARG